MKRYDSLSKFIKPETPDKGTEHVTSVKITENQRDFIRRHRLNLSALVREYLESIMADAPKGKLK